MKIVIWTQSPPKVAAIEEWVKNSPYFAGEEIEIIPLKVSSGISDMPLSLEENMAWAKNRAENARKELKDADFYIWMEWGTTIIGDKAYLFWVVYILSKDWEGHFWFSGKMEVPKIYMKRLYEDREKLHIIEEDLHWMKDLSNKNGSFWLWSDDTLTRKDQFLIAFKSAIPPFFNKYYKM
jgi:non-canonical (house-cleaning) NTP pyrophosphatase